MMYLLRLVSCPSCSLIMEAVVEVLAEKGLMSFVEARETIRDIKTLPIIAKIYNAQSALAI